MIFRYLLLSLILVHFRFATALYQGEGDYVTLDKKHRGAICSFITYDDKKGGSSIGLDLERSVIKLKDGEKVPYLIFYYSNLLNFANVPSVSQYIERYQNPNRKGLYEGLVDFNEGRFMLEAQDGADKVDNGKVITGYVDKDSKKNKDDARLDVKESGVYCVYAAPLSGIEQMNIPVEIVNSYGYLPYLLHAATKYLYFRFVLDILLFSLLTWHILKFKVGDNFSRLSDLSLISKGVLFYILLPSSIVLLLKAVYLSLENAYVTSSNSATIFRLVGFCIINLSDIFSFFCSFLLLLFTMGMGVIYYPRSDNPRNIFPTGLLKKAKGLFLTGVVLVPLVRIFGKFDVSAVSTYGSETQSIMTRVVYSSKLGGRIYLFFCSLVTIYNIASFVIVIYYYRKTKKSLKQKANEGGDEERVKMTKILSSFNRSLLVVLVLPFVVIFVALIPIIMRSADSSQNMGSIDLGSMPLSAGSRDPEMVFLVQEAKFLGIFLKNLIYLLPTDLFLVYTQIILIYVFWIRHDVGLVESKSFTERDDQVEMVDV